MCQVIHVSQTGSSLGWTRNYVGISRITEEWRSFMWTAMRSGYQKSPSSDCKWNLNSECVRVSDWLCMCISIYSSLSNKCPFY